MEEERDTLSTALMVALPDLISKVGLIGCYSVNFPFLTSAGPLAQSVERRADNAKVVSSRLTWTIFFSYLHMTVFFNHNHFHFQSYFLYHVILFINNIYMIFLPTRSLGQQPSKQETLPASLSTLTLSSMQSTACRRFLCLNVHVSVSLCYCHCYSPQHLEALLRHLHQLVLKHIEPSVSLCSSGRGLSCAYVYVVLTDVGRVCPDLPAPL